MILKRPLTLNSVLLACIGLGLIVAGFLLLVPPGQRNDVAWLDLLVAGIIFLFNLSSLPIVRPRSESFAAEIPKLGSLWTTHITYTSLALGGIMFGWSGGLPFRFQLLYHLALLFGLLVVVSVAGKASEHVGRITIAEQHKSDSLQTLKSAVTDCDAAFLRLDNGKSTEYSEFQRIKEDVRYLSPCDSPNAISLDLEIAWMLGDLSATLSASNQAPTQRPNLQTTLTRCRTLVQLRKQERQM